MADAHPPQNPDLFTARTTPEHEPEFELPIEGFKGTPDEIERQWFEKVYTGRGDRMAQLTLRAVLMGSVLGAVLSLTNIYIGLKAGWGFGVAITACILSYAIWMTLRVISAHLITRIAGGLLVVGAAVSCYWVYPFLVRTLTSRLGEDSAPLGAGIGCAILVGVALTLALLVYRRLTPMTILENNCMQSTASAAGYSTGGTLISAYAAYLLLNEPAIPVPQLMLFTFFLAVLGVTMAVPMKRQMINIEQLRFPSGIAAAETLRALHAHGAAAMRSAKALFAAGILAALHKFWWEGLVRVSTSFKLSESWEKYQLSTLFNRLNALFDPDSKWGGRTVLLALDPIFLAAGAITGLRVCASMMLGAVLCWMVYIPIVDSYGLIERNSFSGNVQWSLWAGTACMVTSSLVSFGAQWRSIVRAFSGLAGLFSNKSRGRDDLDAIETPTSWFMGGQLVALIGLVYVGSQCFNMPWWQTAIAVVLSFFLALVACRVTGETDTTPIGAMGKITQLTFGVLSPGNKVINLMSANVTSASAASAADLLTDLKSGYLLGAHPRKQFIAQFAGVFTGTVVTVLAFNAMVPDPSELGTVKFPAPAALTWKGVADALSMGISTLHPVKVWGLIIGGAVGFLLPILSMIVPAKAKPFVPSAAGLGLSWVFPWTNALDFFLGSVLGYIFTKASPKASEQYTFPVASGLIAGGSLMGVALIFWENGREIFERLLGSG